MSKIDELIKQIQKDIDGLGSASTLANMKAVESIPFGIPSLDKLTGNGGAPRGMITEVFGKPSSGKTSLSLNLVTQAQKMGIKCAYIDVELALNKELAQQSGVNIDELVVFRPLSGEETFEIVENVADKGFGLIIVDSIASLSAESELESDYDEQTIGLQARLISKAMRKVIGCIYRNNSALVFINQIRAAMAKMPGAKTTTTSGGMAIPFYAALRLETIRTGWIKDSDNNITGMDIKIRSEKNKLHRPQLETEVEFIYGSGFNALTDRLNMLVADNKVELVGRTYFVNSEKVGDKTAILDYLKSHAEI